MLSYLAVDTGMHLAVPVAFDFCFVTRKFENDPSRERLLRENLRTFWKGYCAQGRLKGAILFIGRDLGFVLQGHSDFVQAEEQAGAGKGIDRELCGESIGRDRTGLQIYC